MNEAQQKVETWLVVTREKDGDESYAEAQFNLGVIFNGRGDSSKARECWSNIKREDGNEVYAKAQFNLGVIFDNQGDLLKARECWSNIKREDGNEVYATAQFNLGVIFDGQGDLLKARECWGNIKREDGNKLYAIAQFNLGNSFSNTKEIDQARHYWNTIEQKNHPEAYAKAQFNLGNSFKFVNLNKAREHWNNVSWSDSPKEYSKAQFNLGVSFSKEDKLVEARNYWSHIVRDDCAEEFAKAQLSLGASFFQENNLSEARKYWHNITKSDSKQGYAKAQYFLGISYWEESTLSEAQEFWKKVEYGDSKEEYASAQLYLGISYLKLNDFTNSLTYFKNVPNSSSKYYSAKMYQRILEVGDQKKSDSLLEIRAIVESILLNLVVGRHLDDSKVAHYTTVGTAHLMLSKQKGNEEGKSYSPLRLTTIQNVNDPTEGKLLSDHLKVSNDNSLTDTGRFQAFIACFSFNHDWLNQFRLYGKSNHLEASGVSLVFNQQFFSRGHDIGAHIKTTNNATNIGLESKEIPQSQIADDSIDLIHDKNMIYPLSLYRCIYFDPKTKLIKLARREEWTFYCESLADGEAYKAKDRWQDYENAISKKENQVEKLYQDLEKEVTTLLSAIRPRVSAKKSVQEQQMEMQALVLTVLDEILIQLRFLIKHMAFREEQECRLYYVTDLLSPFVKGEFSCNSLYVNYQIIPEYVDKIYLGPEAIKQQSFFVKALGEKAFDDKGRNRIRISSNPFRNPQH